MTVGVGLSTFVVAFALACFLSLLTWAGPVTMRVVGSSAFVLKRVPELLFVFLVYYGASLGGPGCLGGPGARHHPLRVRPCRQAAVEDDQVLGLKSPQIWLLVLLPQAPANMRAALLSHCADILKQSTLLSAIGVYETCRRYCASNPRPFGTHRSWPSRRLLFYRQRVPLHPSDGDGPSAGQVVGKA